MLTATGVWPDSKQTYFVGPDSRIRFSVTATISSNVVVFYLLVWSMEYLQPVVLRRFWLHCSSALMDTTASYRGS